MLAAIEKSSISDTKLVHDKRELEEIHESLLEMKSDPHKDSKLLSTFCSRDREVMAVFGEISELEDLLGEFPEL